MSYRVEAGSGVQVWAHGLQQDPDGGVAAVEVAYVDRPGDSVYEGTAGAFAEAVFGDHFDDKAARYAEVIRDPRNPLTRLRIVASTAAAAEHLSRRARRVAGDVEVQAVHVAPGRNL